MNKISDFSEIPKEEIFRKKILAAARTLFIEQGVENVNMHQIAKMAEIGQASLYRRYTEKGEICMQIVLEECQQLFDESQVYLNQASDTPPLDRLYQIIVSFVTFQEAKSHWLCAVSRASPGYRPLQSPLFKWMRNICSDLLNEAKQKGTVSDVDVLYTVEALLSVLQNVDCYSQDQGFETKRILQGLSRIFIEGLKK